MVRHSRRNRMRGGNMGAAATFRQPPELESPLEFQTEVNRQLAESDKIRQNAAKPWLPSWLVPRKNPLSSTPTPLMNVPSSQVATGGSRKQKKSRKNRNRNRNRSRN